MFELDVNATMVWWVYNHTDILFPETKLLISGVEKLRGGAPVCSPVFGRHPEGGVYSGIDLPQHGLVRLGPTDERCEWSRQEPNCIRMRHNTPWPHLTEVIVMDRSDRMRARLIHRVRVVFVAQRADARMPLSIGFHPYFATHGGPFVINASGKTMLRSDEIKENKSFYLERPRGGSLEIVTAKGAVLIHLPERKDYERFCIWTDSMDRYICVEPVLGKGQGDGYRLLRAGESIDAVCRMEFVPRH